MAQSSRFVYVTYIRTTPAKLWQALRDPEFTRKYWMGVTQDCSWKPGATWKMILEDGRVSDTGTVKEIVPEKKLVLSWQNQARPELTEEGVSTMTMELEQVQEVVKLTIVHTIDRPESKLINAVSNGWPKILSNLKSLLETGEILSAMRDMPKC